MHPDPAVATPPLVASLSIPFYFLFSCRCVSKPFSTPVAIQAPICELHVSAERAYQLPDSCKRPIFRCLARLAFLHLAG